MTVPKHLKEAFALFKTWCPKALSLNHYELAIKAKEEGEDDYADSEIWKEFLKDTNISNWIASELDVLKASSLNKLVANAGDSNSVGRAQLINALGKVNESSEDKNGPAYIYTYIPPNPEQLASGAVGVMDYDPFLEQPTVAEALGNYIHTICHQGILQTLDVQTIIKLIEEFLEQLKNENA